MDPSPAEPRRPPACIFHWFLRMKLRACAKTIVKTLVFEPHQNGPKRQDIRNFLGSWASWGASWGPLGACRWGLGASRAPRALRPDRCHPKMFEIAQLSSKIGRGRGPMPPVNSSTLGPRSPLWRGIKGGGKPPPGKGEGGGDGNIFIF